jgi:hypothetical protein
MTASSDAIPSTASNAWVSVLKPGVIVEKLGEAEFRVGEMTYQAIVYQRKGRTYCRLKSEFYSKFRPM